MTTTYNIDASNLGSLEAKFEKLTKRAIKLGVEAPGFAIDGEHLEYEYYTSTETGGAKRRGWSLQADYKGRTGAVRVMKHVVLTGAPVVKLAGWVFIAALDHELGEGNTIVNGLPGVELPNGFQHKDSYCDHCRQTRVRKTTYVVRHDENNETKQVGSTCLHDFLGVSAAAAVAQIEMLSDAVGALEAAGGGFDDGATAEPKVFDLVDYLAWVAMNVRVHGWLSRADASAQMKVSTADAAYGAMLDARKGR